MDMDMHMFRAKCTGQEIFGGKTFLMVLLWR